ncbi:MAG: amidohydrolase [Candidatus Aegiribacteria sp.]|nr:amidohydrolase [Candidatus Aegiribacteria sp.]MBD3294114.1 amidohydrolase [Candidatus Fermentibacteria bacterium]
MGGTDELVELRHLLHRNPEISGEENRTARILEEELSRRRPDRLVTGLGGTGLAALYRGKSPGPSVLLRCDTDALPIDEAASFSHSSEYRGKSHKCGHDGHMAILMGVASALRRSPPDRGSVVLLFQPAEETGEGAAKVIEDEKFSRLHPDLAFSLHNLPGFQLGSVIVKEGVFASASRGMIVKLHGASSHAAEPHLGRSPALAAAQLIESLTAIPQTTVSMDHGAKVTVIHAVVGEEAFGTSPGEATVMATLRTHLTETMDSISKRAGVIASSIAEAYELDHSIKWTQEFPSTVNSTEAVKRVKSAARKTGMPLVVPDGPFPWSEDFGHFTDMFEGSLFGLGAGTNCPALHSPEYDFPDYLISAGVELFLEIIHQTTS